jgi:hypothetical protein
MRRLLAAVLPLVLASVVGAETIVVLAKGRLAGPGIELTPAEASFAQAARSATANGENLPLIAPPEWGRTVPGALGSVQLHPAVAGGLILHVKLAGLSPAHRYLLTLNGNPQLAGNDRLPDLVPGMADERYLDFYTATTDARGAYEATFGVRLPPGPYQPRFYVKDTDDFKIVLYHDYFPCAVQ